MFFDLVIHFMMTVSSKGSLWAGIIFFINDLDHQGKIGLIFITIADDPKSGKKSVRKALVPELALSAALPWASMRHDFCLLHLTSSF